MILRELLTLLNKIKKCHPEAANADVVAVNSEGEISHVSYVGYDNKKKLKHNRIFLEE